MRAEVRAEVTAEVTAVMTAVVVTVMRAQDVLEWRKIFGGQAEQEHNTQTKAMNDIESDKTY